MSTTLLDINQINIKARVRYAETPEDKANLERLAASIKRFGVLQPILLGPDNVLIAGWRRYTASQMAGLTQVPVHYRETLSDADYQEIEYEENFQRLDFTWQQTVDAVCKIHATRKRQAAIEGTAWTRQMTGALLGGYSDSYVDNCINLQPYLVAKDKEIIESEDITSALRVILRRREDEAMKEKARRSSLGLSTATALPNLNDLLGIQKVTVNPNTDPDHPENWKPCIACDGTGKTSKGLTCHVCLNMTKEEHLVNQQKIHQAFAEIKAKQPASTPLTPTGEADLLASVTRSIIDELIDSADDAEHSVDLSHTTFLGDSARVILPAWPPECVDHVITDMPYAIDVDLLQQSSEALIDVSRISSTHQVGENLDLYSSMFPAVFRVLKDGGFFITWCDIMNWQYLYDLAINTGFKVQRWPITWHKTSICKCQMAHVLFTKNTEIALVCRKGKASLPAPVQSCVIAAPNDSAKVSNPFAKPFAVWEFLIESVSIEGQSILDPCAGEGSCTIAALRMNRKALAIEKDETHYPYLVENVKNYWKSVFKKVRFE